MLFDPLDHASGCLLFDLRGAVPLLVRTVLLQLQPEARASCVSRDGICA